MSTKVKKKLLQITRKRELLYAEAQQQAVEEQREQQARTTTPSSNKKFNTVDSLFNSYSRTKPRTYKALYYKASAINHIIDISDTNVNSPQMLLTEDTRASLKLNEPHFERKTLPHISKCMKKTKTTKRGLIVAVNQLKTIKSRDPDTIAAISIIKFVGDTIPSSLLSIGVKMKMDLRLIAVIDKQIEDHEYGELAKQSSAPKHYKDKRKCVMASKTLLNTIINQNDIQQKVAVPYYVFGSAV